jgi:hypothetical protein
MAARCGNSDQAVGRDTPGSTNGSGIQAVLQVVRIVLDPHTAFPITTTRQPTLMPNSVRLCGTLLEPMDEIVVDILLNHHTSAGGKADTNK